MCKRLKMSQMLAMMNWLQQQKVLSDGVMSEIIGDIGISHPIVCDDYNICDFMQKYQKGNSKTPL